ncbi:hypothetical protein PPYR_03518 [Photinus pyralis]|uniref:Uncharacterized protein n=1 Tax=Photinus pyralis TaxID=7054 RepID=A0A5N4A360_PHOPY|nr:hypothetical protein PPYR_03518 [Photinus pyralis]
MTSRAKLILKLCNSDSRDRASIDVTSNRLGIYEKNGIPNIHTGSESETYNATAIDAPLEDGVGKGETSGKVEDWLVNSDFWCVSRRRRSCSEPRSEPDHSETDKQYTELLPMREPNNLFLQYENRKLSESFHSDLEKELFEPVSHKSEKIKILDNIVIRAADIDSPNNCDPLRPLNKNNETSSISASFDDDQRDADFDPADYHLRNNTSNETDETYQDASYAPIADLNPINAIETEAAFQSLSQQIIKKHKRERISYVCSNRMRELARLLIAYRDIVGRTNVDFKQLLLPKNFDSVLSAVRIIVGYDPIKNTFKTPSLAMHLGTSLKLACQELSHLVLKETRGFRAQSPDLKTIWLKDIKNFKMLVESRWNIELASLANKDLMEKRWQKPLLLPLVSDIKIFRDECLKMAEECENVFRQGNDDRNTYKLLLNCTLALLIVFNRRRIGDIQYLKIADYKRDIRSDVNDFESVLTDVEKMLTSKYKRVVNGGKGNRAVVILIPELLQRFIDIILKNRDKYITSDNEYVFAVPGSTVPWGKGDVAIRALTKNMKLKNPTAISSNKLRKQIATVMQLLNLSKDESKQFAQFMGHTEKTHQEFYELPVDIYQTAKVSKILLASEKGIPAQYKGRSLADINFDENLEYAVENNGKFVICLFP